MSIVRNILVNGAWYPQIEASHFDPRLSIYTSKVRRPSGEEATVYSRTAGGPFVFHIPNQELQ